MKNIILILAVHFLIAPPAAVAQPKAKNKPSIPTTRSIAFKRANSLDNGISISWLEQTWNKDILKRDIDQRDFNLLKVLGLRSIRLPVAFGFFEKQKIPLESVLKRSDTVVSLCNKNGFKLVIDYHYGEFNDTN